MYVMEEFNHLWCWRSFTPSLNLYSINLINFQTVILQILCWGWFCFILTGQFRLRNSIWNESRIVLAKQWNWRILCYWVPIRRKRIRTCLHGGGGGPQMGEVTRGGSLICRAGYLTYLMESPTPPPPPLLCKRALTHQTVIRVKQMGLLISKDKVEKERREWMVIFAKNKNCFNKIKALFLLFKMLLLKNTNWLNPRE